MPLSPDLDLSVLGGTAAVFSRGLERVPHLQEFLGASQFVVRPRSAEGLDYVVGWGHKPTTVRARRFAEKHNLPFIRLEDGFLRSTYPGTSQPSASMVIDPIGIYYDARTPSRLEALLSLGIEDTTLLERARAVATRIVDSRLSKYNQSPLDSVGVMQRLPLEYILIIDQIAQDASVQLSAGQEGLFEKMVRCAATENPGLPLVIKAHPAARSSSSGALSSKRNQALLASLKIIWLTEAVNPHALLAAANKVYVATSQLGFEALLHNKPVVCFGAPFYAGWGLTDDRSPICRRVAECTLDQLVAASLLLYSRYVHPVTGKRCELEEILEHFELQNEHFARNQGTTYCFGFWWWKRAHARRFLSAPGNEPIFCWDRDHAVRQGFGASSRALAWGTRATVEVESLCRENGVGLEKMEDGFIRSVGLGSDLTAPWSLVVDRRGIYYDPRQASDLEILLAQHSFSEKDLSRARNLRQLLLASGISKYNPVRESSCSVATPEGDQRRILVPGQVEADASVLLGSPAVRSNLELLRRVRANHPSAHITFKPHPDVEAGNRPGRVLDGNALLYCNSVVRDRRIADCLAEADELHTMTSLVGFEALLRGLAVEVYGQPFYAGWGLTKDHCPPARRRRSLTLDELVAGSLLLYPRYVAPESGYFCTAEQAVAALVAAREKPDSASSTLLKLPLGRPALRAYQFVRGMVVEARRV